MDIIVRSLSKIFYYSGNSILEAMASSSYRLLLHLVCTSATLEIERTDKYTPFFTWKNPTNMYKPICMIYRFILNNSWIKVKVDSSLLTVLCILISTAVSSALTSPLFLPDNWKNFRDVVLETMHGYETKLAHCWTTKPKHLTTSTSLHTWPPRSKHPAENYLILYIHLYIL